MEQTTTDASAQDDQALDAQPVEEQAEAVQTVDSEPQQPESSDDGSGEGEPEEADNSQSKTFTPEWLESKGIDLSAPDAAEKLANMAFNSEKMMSQTINKTKSSELEKSVQVKGDGVSQQSTTDMVLGALLYKQTHPELTSEQDNAMGEYINSNPDAKLKLSYGLYDYDDIFVKSGAYKLGQPDASALKKQGSQEALQQLADKQRATAVRGNASTTTVPQGVTKSNVDSWWEGLGSEGRANPENRAKLDQILNS